MGTQNTQNKTQCWVVPRRARGRSETKVRTGVVASKGVGRRSGYRKLARTKLTSETEVWTARETKRKNFTEREGKKLM